MIFSIYYVKDWLRGKMWGGFNHNPSGKARIGNVNYGKRLLKSKSTKTGARKSINERIGRVVGGLLTLFFVLSLPVIYAKPTVVVTGVTIKPDGTYYKEIQAGQETTLLVKVQNLENATYRYYVNYNGALSTVLKRGTSILGSGTVFTTNLITINPNENHVLYLVFNPTTSGVYNNQIKFHFEKQGTNNTWTNAGDTIISLQLKVTGSSSQQPSSGSGGSGSSQQQPTQTTTQCLELLRSKVYKVVYLNDSLDISIGVMNTCEEDEIKIVDADLEGVPTQIAYIKDAELGKLDPGEVTYLKIHFSSKPFTQPTSISFDLIVTAKHGTKIEHESANININVISEEQLSYLPQIKPHEEENSAKPLNVDYVLQSGYLIVKGVYYEENGTKIYLKNVPVDILVDNQRFTYMAPMSVEPGKTYCIAASAEGYISFFKCISVPKKKMCITLKPEGKRKDNTIYYEVGTNVTIDSVYECNSVTPVENYKVIYSDKLLETNTFNVLEGNKQLKIIAKGYDDLVVNVFGYKPLRIMSSLPHYVGNFSLRLSGTFSDTAKVSLSYKDPKTNDERVVYSGSGSTHSIALEKPGTYVLTITTSVDEIERTFVVKEKTSSGIDLISLASIPIIIVVAFAIFTAILYIVYRKFKKEELYGEIHTIDKMMK